MATQTSAKYQPGTRVQLRPTWVREHAARFARLGLGTSDTARLLAARGTVREVHGTKYRIDWDHNTAAAAYPQSAIKIAR